MEGSSARTKSGTGSWTEEWKQAFRDQPRHMRVQSIYLQVRGPRDQEAVQQPTPQPPTVCSDFREIHKIQAPVPSQTKPVLNTHV